MSSFGESNTAPIDFRFPVTQQTKHCWSRFNEFLLCANSKGEDNPACTKLKKYAMVMCPMDWLTAWEEDRREHKFVGVNSDVVAFADEEE